MALYYPPTINGTQKTLGAQLLSATTAAATLNNVVGIQNKAGVMVIDRVDTAGVETPTKREYISFAGTSGATVTTLVRNVDGGGTQQDHAIGAIVEFVPDVIWAEAINSAITAEHSTAGVHSSALVTTLKATGAVINTGTSDVTIVTPKAIADSYLGGATSNIQAQITALPTATSTTTFTNKRITQRVITTTDDATAVIDCAVTDQYELSAIANATEFTVTGTPTDGQKLIIRFKDAGAAKALTFTGFTAMGATIPTTTVQSKWGYVGAIYNSAASTWHAIAVGAEA